MQLLVILVVVECLLSGTTAQIIIMPEACTCPDECICDVSTGTIDCTGQGLRYVPVELNSCSWPGITKIDLSGNRIREVEEYAFSLQGDVTHLYLYDNQIEVIDRSAFVGMRSLEFLFLDGNRIGSLPSKVFRSLRKLKRLLLYSNLLTSLPFGIFVQNSELSTLALHENRLSYLQVEIFDDVPLLKELYLHGNHLTDLSNSPFRSLTKLNLLYLSDNRLTTLTRFDFSGLFSLNTLLLSNNVISTIDNEAFNPLQELQYLYLENNLLTEITRLTFAPPVRLRNLRLFNNRISSISNGAFFRLRQLQFLSLHSNQLTEIIPPTFVGLDSITELVLYNNRISQILDNSFVQCPLMERLWLYNNNISCCEPDAFRGMGNLQILQLGSNKLSYLPNDLFQNTLELQYLLLYGNNLESISNQPFRNLGKLVQLSIYFNPITYIAEGALDGAENLYYIQFSENGGKVTLVCDCSSLWLYNWMIERPLQTSMVCATPLQYTGHDIRSLQPASFGCSSVQLGIEVGPQCDNHVVPIGGCLRLTCSSTPKGPVSWSRLDGQPIRTTPYTCGGKSPCSGGAEDEGTLLVENITPDDAGIYICTTSFGNETVRDICRVTVGEPPRLLLEPENVYLAYPGRLARFSLSFTGTPQPTVQWYQITASGSEIALHETGPSSRYVMSEYGTLVILDTVVQDEGRYKAIISNGAGEISVDTELFYYFENSCRAECQNGGTCVTLHLCRCTEDFAGRYCDTFAGEEITTELPETSPLTLAPPIPTTTFPPLTTTHELPSDHEVITTDTTTTDSDITTTATTTITKTLSSEELTTTTTTTPQNSEISTTTEHMYTSTEDGSSVSGSGSGLESGDYGYESGSGISNEKVNDVEGLEGLADDEDYGLDYKRQVRRERRSLAGLKHKLRFPSQHREIATRPLDQEVGGSHPNLLLDEVDIQRNKDVELQQKVREMYSKEEEFEAKLKEVRQLAAAKKRLKWKKVTPQSSTSATLDPVLSSHLPESEPLVISEALIRPARDVNMDFYNQRHDDVDVPEAMDWKHVENPLPEVPVASWREKE